jgi:NADH-quinone oxidoreductase subunit J
MLQPLLILPAALGLAAVYLLLPRPRPYPWLWGAVSAAVALLLAAWLLLFRGAPAGETVEKVLFTLFALIAVVSGGLLVTQHNPVYAALAFALVVLSTCGLFLLQAAPFLMAATIIVYAGAIIVTFLFVIMLAQQSGLSDADLRSREPLLACVAGFVVLVAVLYVLGTNYDNAALDALLRRTEEALQGDSVAAMQARLGPDYFETYQAEAKKLRSPPEAGRLLAEAAGDAEGALGDADAAKAKKALTHLRDVTRAVRDSYGSLQPTANLPLSGYSGIPANRPAADVPRDTWGRPLLPAENVAHLGRSLFTDFLLAVELGGTLLLVATVGAIVIAGRRTEGLR